ncbi:MAG: hypothetical protein HZB38_08180 [Planctomycetes bacterium]|nr:hypothetical protein [Planctomycetota bacterium]
MRSPLQLDAAWENYERVVVQTRNGDVDVQVVPGAAGVRVRGEKWAGGLTGEAASDLLEEIAVTVQRDPSDPHSLRIALNPPSLDRASYGADLQIEIPTAAAAELRSSNGRISARGLARRVVADTSNGDVVLADVAGDAQVDTSNGNVTAERVAGSLIADTSNGNIACHAVTGQCRLDTSNGNIEVVGAKGGIHAEASNGWLRVEADPPADATIALSTSNGSMAVQLPAALRGELDLRTSNGVIQTDFGSAALSDPILSKSRMTARLNGGGPAKVIASTSNGSVTLTLH